MKFLTALSLLCIVSMQFLIADAEDGVQDKCFKTTEPLELTCSGLSEKAEWVKEEGVLEPNVKFEVMDGHKVLKIEKAKVDHAGKYTCKEGASKQTFEAQLAATIHKFPASANIVEGEKYTLKCEVYGTLLDMEVKWYKDDEYINLTDSNVEHRNMSVLIITEIKAEDRGNYTCKASNRCGQASRSIYIRVVDKYAALWPFLGICAEVIVLCTVIFIYEKRRSKAEFDESDGEQNNDTKHVGNAKDSEVRQRK